MIDTLQPQFAFWPMLFTAIGSAVVWARLGKERRRVLGLSHVVEFATFLSPNAQRLLEFVIFVSLGCLICAGVVKPSTLMQALTAGMGWTSMLSTRAN